MQYRKILCLHTLSTLCSIDFELRHTFWPADSSRRTIQSPHSIVARSSLSRRELKCNSTDPISRITRVSFDSQEKYSIFYSLYRSFKT